MKEQRQHAFHFCFSLWRVRCEAEAHVTIVCIKKYCKCYALPILGHATRKLILFIEVVVTENVCRCLDVWISC